jgi:PAS domain S-box-containing protein
MTEYKGSEISDESREPATGEDKRRRNPAVRPARRRVNHPPGEEACRILADHASQGLMILQDNRVAFCNQAAGKILGRTTSQLLSATEPDIETLAHLEDRPLFHQRYQDCLDGKSVDSQFTFRICRDKGGIKWLQLDVTGVTYQGHPAVHVAMTNITSCKMALEHMQVQETAERGRAELLSIFDSSPNVILITDLQGNIRTCNRAAMDVLGCAKDQILGKNFLTFIAAQDHPRVREDMHRIVTQGSLKNVLYSALRADGSPFIVDASTGVIRGELGEATGLVAIVTDVTEREWAKAGQRLSHQILEISNQHALREPMLRQIVLAIQDFAKCQAVGIRILDEKGDIPYEAYTGFSREFYERESPLSIHNDRCMCINVIDGKTDPTLPFYTPHGSFYLNGTTRFLATLSEEDKGRTRNVCNEMGFESVALIPIRSNDDILGLIHLADSREHRVPLSLVEVIENVAMQLAVAVRRALAEEALQHSEQEKSLILNSTSEMFAYYDVDLRIQWLNKTMESSLGVSSERAVGRHCYELRYGKTTPCEYCPLIKASQTRTPQEAEIAVPNGRILFLRGYPLLDDSGQVVALVEIADDITDRKQAQEALRKSEERFRAIVNNAAAMVAVVDTAGRWIHVNQYLLDVLGYSYEELAKMQMDDTTHPEDRLSTRDLREQLIRGEIQQYRVERRHICKNGQIIWVDLSVSALHDEQGRVEALLGVAFNVTQRKKAAEALQHSERKFRAIADNTVDVEIWIGPDGQPIWLNPAIERFTGYTVEECMAMPDFPAALIHPEDRPRILGLYQQACAGASGNDVLYRLLRRDGSALWVSMSWQPIFGLDGECLGWRSSHRHVADRVRAEEELRQSEYALRAAQKVAHVGSWTWHIPSNRLEWSDEMYRIFGIEKKDFSGDLAEVTAHAIHPEDRAAVERVNRLAIEERRHSPLEFRLVRPDGTVRIAWAEAGEMVLDKDGNPTLLTGIVQDITDRKNAQQALAESERRYRLLFDEMLSGLALHEVVFDASGAPVDYRFLSVNAAFEKMTGLHADEILGKTVLQVMPGIERSWIARYGQVATTGEPMRFEDFAHTLNRHFDVRAYCPRPGQFAVVFHDITEQKQAQQRAEQRQAELLHVSRLSTLGEMASGFAHELNQPLSAIMSYASASRQSVQKNDFDTQKLVTNLDHIVAQSNRAGDIIRRVRAFAQRRPPRFELVDVNKSIREVLSLLHSSLRNAGVEVILELSEDLPEVLGDTIQLEQVLVNLMRNAVEAMEGVDPRRRRLTARTFTPSQDLVTVIVSDTGPGIDEKMGSKVFDPFFTTKENGLGIGLSISRSIIESHRGHLSVAPGADCGCTFTFTLPALRSCTQGIGMEPGAG